MNPTAKNRSTDFRSVTQISYLVIAAILAPPGVLLGWTMGGLGGSLYALAGIIVAALAVAFWAARPLEPSIEANCSIGCIDRIRRDHVLVILSQARFHKMSRRYDLALACIDNVLAADPDLAEALFVKAQILWEGNRQATAAKQCLSHLMLSVSDPESSLHRWSRSLYREINEDSF